MIHRASALRLALRRTAASIETFLSRLRQLITLVRRGRWAAIRDRLGRALASEALPLPRSRLDARFACSDSVVLVIDGSHGGGAAAASARACQAITAAGQSVLRLGVGRLSGRLQLTWLSPQGELFRGSTRDWPALDPAKLAAVRIDTLAGFADPEALCRWLLPLTEQRKVPVTLHWHDHYLLCPSPHLLHATGRYCGLPDASVCMRCLPQNSHCPHPAQRRGSIGAWRESWRPLLQTVSSLVFASPSSQALFARAYPGVAERVQQCQPLVSNGAPMPVLVPGPLPVHIGVLGRIGHHKGVAVVAELAGCLDRDAGERITVFGTLDTTVDGVRETGAYARDALPQKLVEAGVNALLVPSIWPETFSFVTREALSTGLPVFGFALGAQGEALATAPNGHALPPDIATHELLAELRVAAAAASGSKSADG